MKAFHTCKNKNGKTFIQQSAPFLSKDTNKMWLTRGYYFWPEVIFFAHKWGKEAYNNKYAIVEFDLLFDEENRCYDLVGSLEHQFHFDEIINKIKTKLETDVSKVTINAIISFLRNKKDIFPFIAIRAKDQFRVNKFYFIDSSTAQLSLKERHQICVFEEGKSVIKLKNLVFLK